MRDVVAVGSALGIGGWCSTSARERRMEQARRRRLRGPSGGLSGAAAGLLHSGATSVSSVSAVGGSGRINNAGGIAPPSGRGDPSDYPAPRSSTSQPIAPALTMLCRSTADSTSMAPSISHSRPTQWSHRHQWDYAGYVLLTRWCTGSGSSRFLRRHIHRPIANDKLQRHAQSRSHIHSQRPCLSRDGGLLALISGVGFCGWRGNDHPRPSFRLFNRVKNG